MADNNLQAIKQATIEGSTRIINSTIAMPFNEIKNEAQNFLSNILNIYHSGSLIRTHNSGSEEIMRLWTIYRDKETSQTLALLQNRFALALDSFLQRHIILTYVDRDGNLLLYTEQGEIQILESVGKNAGRANFSSGAWKRAEQIKSLPAELQPGEETDLIAAINESTAKRAEVYRTGLSRYKEVQQGKMHTDLRSRYYIRRSESSIYFPESSFSLGEMAEAYANAIINDEEGINNGAIESSLYVLWASYIVGHKDSIAAIQKGDVVVGTNGVISLAVKGQSASTAKIGQYIVAAYHISQMENLTKEELKTWLAEMPKIDTLAADIEQKAKELGQDTIFEDILSKYIIG